MNSNDYVFYVVILFVFTSIWCGSFAFASIAPPDLTVITDKSNYDLGDTIRITGNVGNDMMKPGMSIMIQIFNPDGNLYKSDTVEVKNGMYFYSFNIGETLASSGYYEIMVNYNGSVDESRFAYGEVDVNPDHYNIFVVNIGNSTYPLRYKVTNGTDLMGISSDGYRSLYLNVKSMISNGNVTIEIPRKILDARNGDTDTAYTVAMGPPGASIGYTKEFKEIENNAYDRTLEISVSGPSEVISIQGTQSIPEFGVTSMIVLAVAIIGIITVGMISRQKFNF